MADLTGDKKDQVKRWMLQKLRERLRSAKVSQSLDRWVANTDATMTVRFEFVLNEETVLALAHSEKAAALRLEVL